MDLVIKNEYPPNYKTLEQVFQLRTGNLYPHNPILYNPSGIEIPPDILYHEKIHFEQQGDNPDKWWNNYISSKEFRLEQELEAYSKQLEWIKERYPNKAVKEALDEMANNLSSIYNLDLTQEQAKCRIRKYKDTEQLTNN
jgi:hypothetical protein|tara:strand:+ start:1023 stop:1442 length:420 start_codon:yes stop_codon:yes gene_type:complete